MSNQSLLVENCLAVSATHFKRAFVRIRKREIINDLINIPYQSKEITINYWSEYKGNETYLVVAIKNLESQEILLSESELIFGTRVYFVCKCGYKSYKLYLPPNKTEFKCRNCHNLKYEITTINRNSMQGKLFYRMNRMIKLTNTRAGMNRIFYKGIYTKRFKRHLNLFGKAGFNEPAEDAKKLLEAIYSQ